jgi:26S proteasome regulatory subunit N2
MAACISSASGLLAMLNEQHPMLKLHALTNLNRLVDNFWPEISTSVSIMYAIIIYDYLCL